MSNAKHPFRVRLVAVAAALTVVLGTASAQIVPWPAVGFPDLDLNQWQEESFAGKTRYELIKENNVPVLKATTDATASVLYKKSIVDISNTPWIDWTWKIDSVYDIKNETVKSGDDFPARVYVTAKLGPLPWQVAVINYVWSSNQPVGTAWPNPYTDKSMMVAVQSGDGNSGEWVKQQRNIKEDFKTYFNKDIKSIIGYAVMVDGDNSAQTGTAYFGDLSFTTQAGGTQ